MKKFVKILVVVLSIGISTFSVIKMVNPDLLTISDSAGGDVGFDGGYTDTAKLFAEKTEAECELEITAFANGKVNVCISNIDKFGSRSNTNGFFSSDQLYDCKYTDDIIFWSLEYGIDNDYFGSIVPADCIGAEIGGVMYKSKTAEIQIEDETFNIKYVLTDLEHIDLDDDTRKILLIDEKGNAHKEINLVNPFD